ncbi:uncharacterized protein LOC125666342 [Ostrea edulis]|uniref:uncharacterized protein LOC125666342 n=1 Tax=Ostrea edulis TaxID=37623 RepID=UPI0024AF10D7|nr:uncharacterized protein LOC125666342 [Ostrea edulis]
MEDAARLRVQYLLAMAQNEVLQQLNLHQFIRGRFRWRRGFRRRRIWRRTWLNPARRRAFSIFDQLLVELRREDSSTFRKFLYMPPALYDEILERVRGRIWRQHTWFREPLNEGLKLAATLRHLVSGTMYSDMQYGWRVPGNTLSVVVREVCQAICEEYADEVMTAPSTPDGWRQLSDGFYWRWNFPHCLAAIDGKHVAIRKPPLSGSLYYNYKGFFSIILLAIVDSDYKFVWCDVGGYGSSGDAQIYNNSEFKELVEDGSVNFPNPDPLPHDNVDMPYFLVGDDAFSLAKNMMKPYGQRDLSREQRILNYRLSRARLVSENAFGIISNRFQILASKMNHLPSTARLIVKTCCILHNLMRMHYPVMNNALIEHDEIRGNPVPGARRRGRNLHDTVIVTGNNNQNKDGKKIRNLLKHWCNSEVGSVPWQDRMVP